MFKELVEKDKVEKVLDKFVQDKANDNK